jgi:peptide deformylase
LETVARGLTAGTFQHEVDHLDGVLFLDRVSDPTTFATWEQFERHQQADFLRRVAAYVRGAF